MVHFGDKAKEGLVLFGKRAPFEIPNRARYHLLAAQQFRRNCGVVLRSKWTLIPCGGEGSDKLA
jgi:hypothetical protein